jgi:LuxR family maltose regulon positive regulatory protein
MAAARGLRDTSPADQPQKSSPGDSLILTKLAIPPSRPALVPRPRLTERLQTGIAGPLTLLSAPAGCGKTTLLCAWCAAAPDALAVAWVSLDAADNDPVRFWSYTLYALDRLAPGACATPLTLLQSTRPPHIELLLTGVLNGLVAVSTNMVLVLDDYHVIEVPAIHQALLFLLDHLPPQLHLVIASRADPPLPLARLRARGAITELRAADLRCTD